MGVAVSDKLFQLSIQLKVLVILINAGFYSCIIAASSASSSTTDEQTTAIMNSEPSEESPKTNEATSAETFKPTDSVTVDPGANHASKDNSGTKKVLIIVAVTASLIAAAISVTVLVLFLCRKR